MPADPKGLVGSITGTVGLNVPGVTFSGSFALQFNSLLTEVKQTFQVGVVPVALELPAGPYVRLAAEGLELNLNGLVFRGDFALHRVGGCRPPPDCHRDGGPFAAGPGRDHDDASAGSHGVIRGFCVFSGGRLWAAQQRDRQAERGRRGAQWFVRGAIQYHDDRRRRLAGGTVRARGRPDRGADPARPGAGGEFCVRTGHRSRRYPDRARRGDGCCDVPG